MEKRSCEWLKCIDVSFGMFNVITTEANNQILQLRYTPVAETPGYRLLQIVFSG
ncbi:MAG: hypothetical protein ACOC6I_02850 [Candidatus Bipolaricaulota bacterium]